MVQRCDVICDLGVVLDAQLTFRQHYSMIVNKAYRQLGLILRIGELVGAFNARDSLRCVGPVLRNWAHTETVYSTELFIGMHGIPQHFWNSENAFEYKIEVLERPKTFSKGMRFKVLAFVVFIVVPFGCDGQLFPVIADLIHCLQYPVRVTAPTCWNVTEKLQFLREIGTHRQIRFSEEQPTSLPWNDHNQQQNMIVVDASCSRTKQLLKDSGQMLYYRVKWILVNSKNSDCIQMLLFLSDLQILISNEIYYICAAKKANEFSIMQVYRYSSNSDVVEEQPFGYWRRGMVVKLRTNSVTANRRQNLNRFKLRASLVITNNDTINHLADYREKQVDTITKKNYFLTLYLVQSLNATVQFSYVNSWGYRNSQTGHFSGMIGELQSDQADLGGTALFLTADRIKEIDYLSMTTPTRAKFIFRSPKLSITDNVFLLPFKRSVWLCIISFIFLSAVLLLVIMLVEFSYTTVRYGSHVRPNLLDTIMNMFGASCQQGSYLEPKSLPARCLILLSLIVLMFLYASYSANIVALIQSPSSKIRTLQDLLNSRLATGAQDTVYNKYYFTHETEPIRKAIFDRKMKDREDTFIPLEKGVEKIRKGLYAFHVELGVCYKVISETYQEDEKCGLQEIEYLNIIDPYYAVKKNSPFREIVRLGLFRLREFGIQDREHSMLYTRKPKCTGGSSFIPVSIVDVWPALMLLGWGFGVSAGVFVVEKILATVRKRKQVAAGTNGAFFKRSTNMMGVFFE
ncbi:uncharacterized protein LOC128736830 [Sabethes cyaneus]|uniref:uncharacterized protein LOC128736830 n=1 Tax=Sabethes cyaneus TaxID=53552 RepID=UPI00237DC1AA|nr:uncharacterized protein LOC128736830 [Sabethes cyaneus]